MVYTCLDMTCSYQQFMAIWGRDPPRLHPRNEVNKLIHAQLTVAVGVEFFEDIRQVVCGNAPSFPEIVRQNDHRINNNWINIR